MIGCGECGSFRKLEAFLEPCAKVVAGVKYVGKIPALKCKKCGAVWHDADDDMQFARTIDRIAKGLEPEASNEFEIRRAR